MRRSCFGWRGRPHLDLQLRNKPIDMSAQAFATDPPRIQRMTQLQYKQHFFVRARIVSVTIAPLMLQRLVCILLLVAAGSISGCPYDADMRCGTTRVLKDNLCVCKPGSIDQDGTCKKLPPAPAGLGDACADDMACAGSDYPLCHMVSEGRGYCTSQDCTSDADCEEGWYCDEDAEPSYCKRVPTGQGESCKSDADCEDYDANYCVMAPFGSFCVERDCSQTSCSPSYSCQDFSQIIGAVPLICSPQF
jgi:hypothetical protein